jgi:glycosyltransferase involved in cell wall biosynthesis
VTFTGFLNQSRVVEAYAAADCLVLPSDAGETWGLVVNEAMACGRPALVSDQAGCAADLIVQGRTGAVFPCGDVAALAALLREWSADAGRCVRAGEEARARVAGYGVEEVVSGVLSALRFVTRKV